MSRIEGSRVLITGGASGIGLGLARAIAHRGGRLVLWDVNAEGLQAAAETIQSEGGQVEQTQVCDVTDRQAVYARAEELKRQHGPVDILINNAGVVSGRSLLECSDEAIERTMNVNAVSHFWTLKAFLPAMVQADRGHVVTIASAAGLMGVNRLVDYCASKHAAVGLDEALRRELEMDGSNVRTTVVCPYFVNTEMFATVKVKYPWLLPFLDQEQVVEKTMQAIEKDRTRVILPRMNYLIFLAKVLPTKAFDRIVTALGVNEAMADFEHAPKRGATVGTDGDGEARQSGNGDPRGSRRPASSN